MRVRIRHIEHSDNGTMARIIRSVMPDFGADAPGFAIHDPSVDNMYEAYQQQRSSYLVCDVNGQVVGGGGVAPLQGGDENICELQKMYFLPSSRGKGFGKQLLRACIREAISFGYEKCIWKHSIP